MIAMILTTIHLLTTTIHLLHHPNIITIIIITREKQRQASGDLEDLEDIMDLVIVLIVATIIMAIVITTGTDMCTAMKRDITINNADVGLVFIIIYIFKSIMLDLNKSNNC